MTTSKPCEECGATINADGDDAFGAAFLTHARAEHPDWAMHDDVAVTNYGEALVRLTGRRERLESIGSVDVEHVTAERIDDFLSFFDHDAFADNPAWAACYCTEPHDHPRDAGPGDVPARPWTVTRQRMIELLTSGQSHGYLAYVDGRPGGWVNASSRAECALYRRGTADDDDAIVISCFVIAPPYRRHGLADALMARVIADAQSRGVQVIEGYPPTDPRDGDAGNFRGPHALYAAHGFEPVGEDGINTVMRRAVP
jgi:GNAT superfamily N-acetyltransferase